MRTKSKGQVNSTRLKKGERGGGFGSGMGGIRSLQTKKPDGKEAILTVVKRCPAR